MSLWLWGGTPSKTRNGEEEENATSNGGEEEGPPATPAHEEGAAAPPKTPMEVIAECLPVLQQQLGEAMANQHEASKSAIAGNCEATST